MTQAELRAEWNNKAQHFGPLPAKQSQTMGFLRQSKQVWPLLCCMHADCHCSKRFRSSRTAVKYGAHVLYFRHLNLQNTPRTYRCIMCACVHGRCKRVILPLNSWQQRLAWKKRIQAFSSVQKHSDFLLYYCVLQRDESVIDRFNEEDWHNTETMPLSQWSTAECGTQVCFCTERLWWNTGI